MLDKPKKTKRARAVRVVAFGGQREQGIVCKVRTPLPHPTSLPSTEAVPPMEAGGSPSLTAAQRPFFALRFVTVCH